MKKEEVDYVNQVLTYLKNLTKLEADIQNTFSGSSGASTENFAKFYMQVFNMKTYISHYSGVDAEIALTEAYNSSADARRMIDELNFVNKKPAYENNSKVFISINYAELNTVSGDMYTDLSDQIQLKKLLDANPSVFHQFMSINPELAVLSDVRGLLSEITKQQLEEANEELSKDPVFAEYLACNQQIKAFENDDIKLKELDDKILANDSLSGTVFSIAQKKLFDHFKTKLDTAQTYEEKEEILSALDKRIEQICADIDNRKEKYLEQNTENTKKEISDYEI